MSGTCCLLVLVLMSASVLGGNTRVVQFHGFSALGSPGATNWSEPKVFNVRNNLEGDVEFRESTNVTVKVYISGSEDDIHRVHVYYDLLEDGEVVELQVYSRPPSQDSSIALIAVLLTAAVALLCVLTVIILCLKRRQQRICISDKKMIKEKTRRLQRCTKTANTEETTCSTSERNQQQPSKQGTYKSASRSPLSARVVLVVFTIFIVAVATKSSSRARIVINVPSYLVKNGTKIFLNENSFSKLLFSSDWSGDTSFIQQYIVPQATSKVPTMDSCPTYCNFVCDRNTQTCICPRGYARQQKACRDVDECTRLRHNCHAQATCSNTAGSFTCTCQNNHWGDGITCTACNKEPCPKDFYESHPCTAVKDRVCTACSPRCDKNTYEAFGCGLNFDRRCVEIGLPLTHTKLGNRTENLKVRHGSRLVMHVPLGSALIEDQFKVNSTITTLRVTSEESHNITLHRSSGFHIDVILDELKLIPSYKDAGSSVLNENKAFVRTPGFGIVRNKFCRYPAPNYYTLSHVFHRKRQTEIRRAVCSDVTPELCPDRVYPGEMYYYRTLNEPCRTAKTQTVCQESNQKMCFLTKQEGKLFCTVYTDVLADVFGVRKAGFHDQLQHTYPSTFCAESFSTCQVCKNNCSSCATKSGRQSCSCCFQKCLARCQAYYEEDCVKLPRNCSVGDTSELKLTANRPSNLRTKFNCYLEKDIPKRLYRVRYRVRHDSSRYQSEWITNSFDVKGDGESSPNRVSKGTNILHGLKITHSVNANFSTFLYLRGERRNENEHYGYRIAGMSSGVKLWPGGLVHIQPVRPFSINTVTWGQDGNCRKLSRWNNLFQKTFDSLHNASVQNKGAGSFGAFRYDVYDPTHPPTLTLNTLDLRSLLRNVVTNGTIKNDESFRSTLSRRNSTWMMHVSGYFNNCPGFIGVSVIDETDSVKVQEQDILVLCPNRRFLFEIKVPRRGSEDNERLFSLLLVDPQKEYKFQLAMVDKSTRKIKPQSVQNYEDSRQNPWLTLMPLFVTTGIVVTVLLSLMIYAQVTTPKEEECKVHLKSGWQIVKEEGLNHRKTSQHDKLKRRHLLLVIFVVAVRVIYSLAYTFSMAFAVLTLIHSSELQTVRDYKDFVQRKVEEGNQYASAMDNFREQESKRILDRFEDIQRSCDYFMNLQFDWFRQNMSCILLENQVNAFDKLSDKFSQRITHKLEKMKLKIKEKTEKFTATTQLKIAHHVDGIQNYGERVYQNGWLSLPRGVFDSLQRRRKREIGPYLPFVNNSHNTKRMDLSSSEGHFQNLFRQKRSTVDNKFIGFLDFVGVLEKENLKELQESIRTELKFFTDGLLDFSDVLKVKKSFQYPLSSVSLCPFQHIKEKVAEKVKQQLEELAERADELARTHAKCIYTNTSNLLSSDSGWNTEERNVFSSERIMFQAEAGSPTNTLGPNTENVLHSAQGNTHYDIQEGDHAEEEVERRRLDILHRQEKLNNLTKMYNEDVFLTTKQAVWSVIAVIDILLLVYRSTKTYQIAMKLVEGFTEVVEHDEGEFQKKNNAHEKRTQTFIRRAFDLLTGSFVKIIKCCKSLQKKIVRTNLVPLCIATATMVALLYLIIAVVFNVINVTVIEELGGFRLVSARLDADLEFTNIAIADQLDFVRHQELPFYKRSINHTFSKFDSIIKDFNNEQEQRVREINKELCDLEYNQTECEFIKAELLDFHLQPCIFPDMEAMQFDDYNGDAYRQQLKYESKRYMDAVRHIILGSVYFVIVLTITAIVVTFLSSVAFLFMKTRGMLRMRTVHLYSSLPQEALLHFKPEDEESKRDFSGRGHQNHERNPQKIQIPKVFLKDSSKT